MKKIFFVITVALLVGCSTNLQQNLNSLVDKVEIASEVHSINVLDVVEGYSPDGIKAITLQAVSESGARQSLRLRAYWYNQQGLPIDSVVSSWQFKQVESGQNFNVIFVAPNSKAADFKVYIQKDPR